MAFQRELRCTQFTSNDDFTSKRITINSLLTSTNKPISALLTQEVEGAERPGYYLSRSFWEAEVNYPAIELQCLAFVFATQKLCHYFLAHSRNLVTCYDLLKYLFSRPTTSRRINRWLVQLKGFDITVFTPRRLRREVMSNLLAQFLLENAHLYMKTWLGKKFALWNLENGVLPSMIHPHAGQVGQKLYYMI